MTPIDELKLKNGELSLPRKQNTKGINTLLKKSQRIKLCLMTCGDMTLLKKDILEVK